jgi:hypothetical protein
VRGLFETNVWGHCLFEGEGQSNNVSYVACGYTNLAWRSEKAGSKACGTLTHSASA